MCNFHSIFLFGSAHVLVFDIKHLGDYLHNDLSLITLNYYKHFSIHFDRLLDRLLQHEIEIIMITTFIEIWKGKTL